MCVYLYLFREANDRRTMIGVFRSFDKDDNGMIDKKELAAVFEEMGKHMPPEHISRMMKLKDSDGNDMLDYEEFVNAVLKQS